MKMNMNMKLNGKSVHAFCVMFLALVVLPLVLGSCSYNRGADGSVSVAMGGRGNNGPITYDNTESFKDGVSLGKTGIIAWGITDVASTAGGVINTRTAASASKATAQTSAGVAANAGSTATKQLRIVEAAKLEKLRILNPVTVAP